MIEWQFLFIVLCILLLFFLLWKEGKRKNKRLLLGRIVATILAVASLFFLTIPLYYEKTIQNTSNHEAILLTEGYNKDSLNHFLAGENRYIPVLNVNDVEPAGNRVSTYTPDVRLLHTNHRDIRTFHLFGNGLPAEDWKAFPSANIVFHPSLLQGITDVHWNQLCKTGEPMQVQGIYRNHSPSKKKIVLTSFGGSLDSFTVTADKSQTFALNTTPKGEGRQTYRLSVLSGSDTIENETIAVQVEEGKKPAILMLSSSPNFETKFLKNTLSKEGYEVSARTTISKNKYAYDYMNTDDISLTTITPSLLQKFDIVIADASELAHLPPSQSAAIQSAVSVTGKGLVVRIDSVLPSSFYAKYFPVSNAGDSAQQIKLSLADTSQKLLPLHIDYPFSIRSNNNNQSLVQDNKNKAYASAAIYGAGKIVVTTLSNTYTWTLAGNEDSYYRFWSTLLTKASAMPTSDESWSLSPSFPVINEPVYLHLQTDNNTRIPQGQVNGTPVYLKNNPDLPYRWSGIYWPRKKGWQTNTTSNGKPFYWYAYSLADWQNVRASQKIVATQQYISSHLYREEKGDANQTERTEFPKLYFLLLFLLSAGFLWAEGKGLFASKK